MYFPKVDEALYNFDFSTSSPSQLHVHRIHIGEDEVLDLLSNLDHSKAMGDDAIGPKLLKACSVSLYLPILSRRCYVYKGSTPSEWKLQCITPILKKGDKANEDLGGHSLPAYFKALSSFSLCTPVWVHTRQVNAPAAPFHNRSHLHQFLIPHPYRCNKLRRHAGKHLIAFLTTNFCLNCGRLEWLVHCGDWLDAIYLADPS